MSRYDRIAILLSVLMVFLSVWISSQIYENMPHIEDEIAYVWQAKLASHGDLFLSSPPCPNCFLVPFVIDYDGIRFGKYPPGWPAVLGIGIRIGLRDWVNPFLSGFSLWLIYLLVKKLSNEKAGLIAASLTLSSPFFLLNSGSLLSHVWTFWLTIVFIHAWIDTYSPIAPQRTPLWIPVIVAGLSLGLLALTRPLTAVGIGIPFLIHGCFIFIKNINNKRKQFLVIAVIIGFLASFIFVWQAGLTGKPFLNPYQLWWPYDKLGFGPDVGLQIGGYSPIFARMNAKFSLRIGYTDLFGWFKFSWIFIPFGLIALWKKWQAWIVLSIFPSLVLTYTLYWIGSWLFGPRYYFEGIIGLILFSAVGIQTLLGHVHPMKSFYKNWRFISVAIIVCFLASANVFFYLPQRIGNMKGLYGASYSRLKPFLLESSKEFTPALVIVHKINHWIEYGTLLELSSPYLDSEWIVTYSRGFELDNSVSSMFPTRSIWHYYPDEPYLFYTAERP